MPIEPEKVTHTSHDLISAINNSNGLKLMPAVSLAIVFSTIALKVMGSDGCGGRSNQTQPFTMSGKPVGRSRQLVTRYQLVVIRWCRRWCH